MRILFLSWRDHKHPKSGGAARYVHEISKRLAASVCSVAIISQSYPGAPAHETVDGVEIFRTGGAFTVFPLAVFEYLKEWRGKCDVVIDHHVMFPFMTPFFVSGRRALLTHHLAESAASFSLPFPFNYPGYLLHRLPLGFYRKGMTITVSDSSARELGGLGFSDVRIVRNGSNIQPAARECGKPGHPSFIYLGRLSRQKNTGDVIEAFSHIKKELPEASLVLAGEAAPGYMEELRRKADEAGIRGSVRFAGFIPEQDKAAALSRSHAFLFPARKEGWSQAVIEANALGIPVIGYDVPGLRDSIIDSKTGFLVDSPKAMADKAVALYRDGKMRARMSKAAIRFAKSLDWDCSAADFLAAISAKPESGLPSPPPAH